jgi:hypothetical protein
MVRPSLEALEDRSVPATTSSVPVADPTTALFAEMTQLLNTFESLLNTELALFQAWENSLSSLWGGFGGLSFGLGLGPTASPPAPTPPPPPPPPPPQLTPTLGQFTPLSTPFDPTVSGDMVAVSGGVYFASGPDLWYLNENTGAWSGPWSLPGAPALRLTLLANGDVAMGVGQGNVDLQNGTTPSESAVVDPRTGIVQLSNLNAGYLIEGVVQAGNGSVLETTAWSGWTTGQTTHTQQGVWSSPDGVHFSLLSQVPDSGALWFISKATDGSNVLYSGGEGPNGPFYSTDNGVTWQPLGTQNSLGFSGNAQGVVELPDGTLLVQKRLTTSAGQFPLVRGKAGGTFVPSATGLPPLLDVYNLTVTVNGIVIAAVDNTSGGPSTVGGSYVSYDNGNTWTSLASNGVSQVPTFGITATATHAYIWPQGQPPMVALL